MKTVTLEEAGGRLAEIIEGLSPGEEVVITRDDRPVARLSAEAKGARPPRRAGNCKGMMTIVADDDDHLKDFAEYMG
jgi:antitoxin (DNA-binding transcriptional repressor) of toxin-antitoxin stability system